MANSIFDMIMGKIPLDIEDEEENEEESLEEEEEGSEEEGSEEESSEDEGSEKESFEEESSEEEEPSDEESSEEKEPSDEESSEEEKEPSEEESSGEEEEPSEEDEDASEDKGKKSTEEEQSEAEGEATVDNAGAEENLSDADDNEEGEGEAESIEPEDDVIIRQKTCHAPEIVHYRNRQQPEADEKEVQPEQGRTKIKPGADREEKRPEPDSDEKFVRTAPVIFIDIVLDTTYSMGQIYQLLYDKIFVLINSVSQEAKTGACSREVRFGLTYICEGRPKVEDTFSENGFTQSVALVMDRMKHVTLKGGAPDGRENINDAISDAIRKLSGSGLDIDKYGLLVFTDSIPPQEAMMPVFYLPEHRGEAAGENSGGNSGGNSFDMDFAYIYAYDDLDYIPVIASADENSSASGREGCSTVVGRLENFLNSSDADIQKLGKEISDKAAES